MIVLYPLALVAAMMLAVSRRGVPGGRGWRWCAAWTGAGAVFTFSFVSGLSIGLLILPLAVLMLLGAAWAAPHAAEMLGFIVGFGAILLVVAWLNRNGHGVDPLPWLLGGLSSSFAAALAYGVLARRSRA